MKDVLVCAISAIAGIRRGGEKNKGRVFSSFIFRLCTIFFFGNHKEMKEVAASSSSWGSCVTEVGGLLAMIWNHVCDVFP